MSSSTLIDRHAVMCGLVRQGVRGVAIFPEFGDRAEDDVGARSSLSAQPVAGEQIVGGLEVVGDDDEEVPVARFIRVAAGAAPEQADLDGAKLFDHARQQVVDSLDVERLPSRISGLRHDHGASLPPDLASRGAGEELAVVAAEGEGPLASRAERAAPSGDLVSTSAPVRA